LGLQRVQKKSPSKGGLANEQIVSADEALPARTAVLFKRLGSEFSKIQLQQRR